MVSTTCRRPLLSLCAVLLASYILCSNFESVGFAVPRVQQTNTRSFTQTRLATPLQPRVNVAREAAGAAAIAQTLGWRILPVGAVAAVAAAARMWFDKDDEYLSGSGKRLALCVALGVAMNLNPWFPQSVAFSIAASTTLGIITRPVSQASAAVIGLSAAALCGTRTAEAALGGFSHSLLWVMLLVPLAASGLGGFRARAHSIVGTVLDKIPVIGKSWSNSVADVVAAPLQCAGDDQVARSMFLTGSSTNILAAGLAASIFGTQGLGVMAWTKAALVPMLVLMAVRPLLAKAWDAVKIEDEDDSPEAGSLDTDVKLDDCVGMAAYAGMIYAVGAGLLSPITAILAAVSVLKLRGITSFDSIDGAGYQKLAVYGSLLTLSAGLAKSYQHVGGALTGLLAAVPMLPALTHSYLLVAGYLYTRRFFDDGAMHVAALFPTFLAALGGGPAAALTLVLATNLGSKDQSNKQLLTRYVQLLVFMLAGKYLA